MTTNDSSAAELAAVTSLQEVERCVDEKKSFRLEAGAGAGKTYSLVHALRYLIDREGSKLMQRDQQVACITYTNAASDEIKSRTDGNSAVFSATTHSFCWSLLQRFQPELRRELVNIPKWPERLEEAGADIGTREVRYDLGLPSARAEGHVSIAHDDVLKLMVAFLAKPKFRQLVADRYPVIFIDEYQDTAAPFAEAIVRHLLAIGSGVMIGFFGDHWQRIYPGTCGLIEDPSLQVIDKHANFRSVKAVVEVLNRMRPELVQHPANASDSGSAVAFHTNSWTGTRQTASPWKGDMLAEDAHAHLQGLVAHLKEDGWDFSVDETKVLMLTHKVLASEQGYSEIANIFERTDSFIRKEDPHILFFADELEPACIAFEGHRYGEMFAALGGHRPSIRSTADKAQWSDDFTKLLEIRANGSVGEVLDYLAASDRIRLPTIVGRRELDLKSLTGAEGEVRPSWTTELEALRAIPYREVIALVKFINGYTPFGTKHGVKGLEFENVLVVIGKGWNNYNFNQMLEWFDSGVPAGKESTFERSRNLFYVTCSRPKQRLALLFTEELSEQALRALGQLFGTDNVMPFALA